MHAALGIVSRCAETEVSLHHPPKRAPAWIYPAASWKGNDKSYISIHVLKNIFGALKNILSGKILPASAKSLLKSRRFSWRTRL